ncbi:MAG: efflux RND transporter periplasmic adaptor subunit [Candidatus Omnitrophota bacterium]
MSEPIDIQKPEDSPEKKSPVQKLLAVLGRLPKALRHLAVFIPKPAREYAKQHRKLVAIVAGVVLVLLFMLRGCLPGGKGKLSLEEMVAQQPGAKEAVIPVKGFKVARFNFEDSLNVLGTIKGAIEFKVSSEVPGVISSINYREGERYEEGALLISLKQDDTLLRLKRAQAASRKAETDVKLAEEKVTENQKLFEMGAIPKSTLDKAQIELDGKKFEAEAARLEMKAHESLLEKSNIYAPSAGMIGELNVEEGETVTANTLLGTHVMTEYVYAEFGVVERDVKKIALGQRAKVFVDAYADKTFEGVIENVAPVVSGTSRTATARVRIENVEGLLLPGMFCRIRIMLYSKKNTLVVPTDAVQGSEGEQSVFIINNETSVVEKRPVTVGYTRPDYSQVDAGISEGEIVAISGLEKLENGKQVKLLEIQEAEV